VNAAVFVVAVADAASWSRDGDTEEVGSIKRVAEVPESALLTEEQVGERLGLSTRHVRWLTINGHLQRGVTPDSSVAGLTRESVEHERAWRSSATSLQRLRRRLSHVFRWMP
jgi:hypothetical protein